MRLIEELGKFEYNPKGYLRYQHKDVTVHIQSKYLDRDKQETIKKFLENFFEYFKEDVTITFKIYTDTETSHNYNQSVYLDSNTKSIIQVKIDNIGSRKEFLDFVAENVVEGYSNWHDNMAIRVLQKDFYKDLKNKVVANAL